jgi:2-polyprenyl-3-methyl-5-hydroxy-6-metoxy-1,4-benzoquinol methylase
MQKSGLHSASVLEVAAGDGYSITCAAERLSQEGLDVNPVCLDQRELNQQTHCCPRAIVGDALDLPFPKASFDFVSCGLFLHHLAPAQVTAFIDGALGVARKAVLINDLRRSPFHLALVHAGTLLMRSPISRYDGVASVRQAYTPKELRELLGQTNATSFEIHLRYLFRMGAIVWK